MAETPKKPGRGFGALGEWASDVEEDVGAGEGTTASSPRAKAEPPVAGSVARAEPTLPASAERTDAPKAADSAKAVGIKIALGFGAVLLVAIIGRAVEESGTPPTRPRPDIAEQLVPTVQPTQAPSVRWAPPPPGLVWEDKKPGVPVVTEQEEAEAEDEAATDDEEEVIPPMGTNRLLGPAELRYCVCEEIRLEGMDREVDTHSEAEVNAYNEAVGDYNARCTSFRYRRGLLERIQEGAELRRGSLEYEGASRLDQVR